MSFYALSNGQSVATEKAGELYLQRLGFYALSNGQSVATSSLRNSSTERPVSMPFLTGSLLQPTNSVLHLRVVYSFYALSNGQSVATDIFHQEESLMEKFLCPF